VARLKPGVSVEQAAASLETIAVRLEKQYPENAGIRPVVTRLRDELVHEWRDALLLLVGAAGLVLLIACANVAHLLLARSAGRRREMAVRAALGAGRLRLLRQLLAEGLLLAALGAAAGLTLAVWGVDLLVALLPAGVPRLAEARLDRVALLFTSAVSLVGGLIFALLPAWHTSRLDLNEALKSGRGESLGGTRLRGALVTAEMALAMTLLIGAGLLLESLWRVIRADPGFRAGRLTTMQISLPDAAYGRPGQVAGFYRRLLERVGAMPGVEACGVTSTLPVSGGHNRTLMSAAGQPPPRPGEIPVVEYTAVSPGYFQAMGIPLRGGRWFTESDTDASAAVTIVDETLARRFWPGRDAVGRQMRYGAAEDSPPITVVGVAGHVKTRGVDAGSGMQMYVPYGQTRFNSLALVVRTREGNDPAAMVRAVVRELDPEVPVSNVRAMDEVLGERNASRRASAILLAAFATGAVLLAAVGLYGVLACAVSQRTREIGVRMALGARRADVLRMVLGQGARLMAAGVILGWLGSLALAKFLGGFLYRVRAVDPGTYAVLSALLAAVALLACYLPARRAASTDPMVALRYE
jgi:predicted permease